MPAFISHVNLVSGKNIAATVERMSDGFRFKPTANLFVDPNDVGVTYSQLRIPLTEGLSQDLYSYTGSVENLSGVSGTVNPGEVRIRIHDEDNANQTIEIFEEVVVGSRFARIDAFVSTRASPDDVLAQFELAITDISTGIILDELEAVPPKNPTIGQLLMLLYMHLRNRTDATADTFTAYNDAGTPIMDAQITETEALSTRAKLKNVT